MFEQRISRATDVLKTRITDYIQILKGCQALFYASDSVTTKDWKTYVENLSLSTNYPGIQAVAFAKYIKLKEVSTLEKHMNLEGHFEFKVSCTFENEYLTPIIYIEPFSGRNLRAFGYDMYSESLRREAMYRALSTGSPSLSRKVTLVQETDADVQPGFLLYLPVYRNPLSIKTEADRKNNILGFVYNPFRAYDLMHAVFKSFSDIHIEIYDGNEISAENLLFKSQDQPTPTTDLSAIVNFNTAGTQWRIAAYPTDKFGSSIEKREPGLVLFFGLAITALMVIISINIIKNKARVVEELKLSREVEKKKDEFIGIASHELKTPLTSIKAYIQLLERAPLRDNERNFVHKVLGQIKKLNNLIADLLDVSKIQAGSLQLNIQTFALSDLITESIEIVSHIHSSHQIVLTSEIPVVQVNGDKFRLEQALTNLLGNAIKYSPGAKSVYVAVAETNNELTIDVKDEGIGISRESQKRIFEKFYRAEGLSSALSGLGMGLFIASEIVSRHSGRISVSSIPGEGSAFTIHLPKEISDTA